MRKEWAVVLNHIVVPCVAGNVSQQQAAHPLPPGARPGCGYVHPSDAQKWMVSTDLSCLVQSLSSGKAACSSTSTPMHYWITSENCPANPWSEFTVKHIEDWKERLFIDMDNTMQIFREIPFFRPQNDT